MRKIVLKTLPRKTVASKVAIRNAVKDAYADVKNNQSKDKIKHTGKESKAGS